MDVTSPDGTVVVYNPGDMAWIIAATALVWIMIPGVGFFYSGLLRRKNALSQIWMSMITLAVVSFQVRAQLGSCAHPAHLRRSGFSGAFHWHSVRRAAASSVTFVRVLVSAPRVPSNPSCRLLWAEERTSAAVNRLHPHPRNPVLCIPADVRRNHVRALSLFQSRPHAPPAP